MLVRHAGEVARQWVFEEAGRAPGFHGAYFAGSTNWLPDDAALPRRCAHARDRVLEQLAALSASDSFHDQVIGWIFPTGVTTHVLLVAGLKNPTVWQRYVAARDHLKEYGHSDLYEALLEVLGCARMSRARVEQHLAALADLLQRKAQVEGLLPRVWEVAESIMAAHPEVED